MPLVDVNVKNFVDSSVQDRKLRSATATKKKSVTPQETPRDGWALLDCSLALLLGRRARISFVVVRNAAVAFVAVAVFVGLLDDDVVVVE